MLKEASIHSEIGYSVLERIKEHVNERFARVATLSETREPFELLFLADPGDDFMPEEIRGDDLHEDLFDKFYIVASALRTELAGRKNIPEEYIKILVDIFDMTRGNEVRTVYRYQPPKLPFAHAVAVHGSATDPFRYWFRTLGDFLEALGREYRSLEEGFVVAKLLLERTARGVPVLEPEMH